MFVREKSKPLFYFCTTGKTSLGWLKKQPFDLLICLNDTFLILSLKLFALVEKISYLEHSGQQMQGK